MIYVLFPAYNEEQVIRPTLRAFAEAIRGRESDYHAVLVDDGSTDATVAEAERAVTESGGQLPLTVLRHGVNRGLGAGLRTGIYWCLDHAGDDDVLVTLDADNTHPPAMIPTLVARVREGFDVAIASRYRAGAEVHGVPGYRRALSDLGRLVFQTLYPIPGVRDYTCCFRAYRMPVLRQARGVYGEELCTARGFEAVMDLLLCSALGFQRRVAPFFKLAADGPADQLLVVDNQDFLTSHVSPKLPRRAPRGHLRWSRASVFGSRNGFLC